MVSRRDYDSTGKRWDRAVRALHARHVQPSAAMAALASHFTMPLPSCSPFARLGQGASPPGLILLANGDGGVLPRLLLLTVPRLPCCRRTPATRAGTGLSIVAPFLGLFPPWPS